ncbi:MAG: PAS domain-containing protein, partial [Victivallaceae bacterium]
MNRFLYAPRILFLALWLLMMFAARADEGSEKRILFITSYSMSYTWTKDVTTGFCNAFPVGLEKFRIEVFELGMLHFSGACAEAVPQQLSERLRSGNYQLIVAIDQPALEMLKRHYEQLPPDIPLLFCGDIHPDDVRDFPHENKFSVLRAANIEENLRLAVKLRPQTREAVIITAAGAEAEAMRRRIGALRNPPCKLTLIDGSDHSTAAMLDKVAALNSDAIVLFFDWQSSGSENYQTPTTIIRMITEKSPVPVFAVTDSYLGNAGLTGGVVTVGKTHGRDAAKLARRILENQVGPDGREPRVTEPTVILNYPAFVRHRLPEREMPEGAFINRPPGWLEANRINVAGGVALLLVLGCWALFYLRDRNRNRRFQAIYSALPQRVVVVNRKGRILFNHIEPHLFGPHELVTLPHQLNEQFKEVIERVFTSGKSETIEYVFGEEIRSAFFSCLPKPVFGEETVMWVSTDITELAHSRAQIAEAAEYFRTTLESIGDGVIVTDADRIVTICNPVAAGFTGYPGDEAIGKSLDSVFHIVSYRDGSPVESPVAKAIANDTIVELANHTDLVSRDGKRYHIADSAAPLHDKSGAIIGAVLVFRDVTEEYDTRDRLQMTHNLLRNASQLANIDYFHFDFKNKVSLTPENRSWPRRDGMPIPPAEWIYPPDLAAFEAGWNDLREGRKDFLQQSYRACDGGKIRYFTMCAQPFQDGEGTIRPEQFFGVMQEVTDIQNTLNECRDANSLLNVILANFPNPIQIKNFSDNLRFLLVNPGFARFFGKTPEEIVGKTDFELFPSASDAQSFRDDDLKAAATGEVLRFEDRFCDVEDQTHDLITSKTAVTRSDGTRLLVAISTDVTELRKQQRQLDRHNQVLTRYLLQDRVVNECLETLILNIDFETTLGKIIPHLGRELGVGCCALYRYEKADAKLARIRKWPPAPSEEDAGFLDVIDEKNYPASFQVLRGFGELAGRKNNPDNSPEAKEINTYLAGRNVQNFVSVPVRFQGGYWGNVYMEFNDDIDFDEAEMRMVRSTARIIEILLEREQIQNQLIRSEAEKNMIWEMLTIPLLLTDLDHNVIRVNPAMERLTGKSAAGIVGLPCFETLCKVDCLKDLCPVRQIAQDGMLKQVERRLYGRDFSVTALPVFENGKLVNILQIFIDVTEINENRRQLLQAIEAAQAANRAKSTFLATMSHEIRTPLNAVIGYSELLKNGNLTVEESHDYLESIHFAGNALLQLINDILDLSKLEAGKMALPTAPSDVAELARELMSIFSHRAREKNIELIVECPKSLPLLELNVQRLRQVLLNLLGNSIKFTSGGRVGMAIDFGIEDADTGTLTVKISDTGVGIAPEYHARIFDPFVQQNHVRGNQDGTGLGLGISKRLVEHMRGKLDFESAVGAGTVFTITLPGIRFEHRAVETAVPAQAPSAAPIPAPVHSVLIVDDVPINVKMLQAMLTKLKLEVRTANSAKEALQKLEDFRPQLILTDMWMPEMNGAEFAAELRPRPEFDMIPIVAVTADTETDGNFQMDHFSG